MIDGKVFVTVRLFKTVSFLFNYDQRSLVPQIYYDFRIDTRLFLFFTRSKIVKSCDDFGVINEQHKYNLIQDQDKISHHSCGGLIRRKMASFNI